MQRLISAVLLICSPLASSWAAQLGPVQPSDTLWKLATAARPDNEVAMVQVVYALWQANPGAFRDNDINYLLEGSQLQIPARAQMLATPVSTTRQWYYQAITRKPLQPQAVAQTTPSPLAEPANLLTPAATNVVQMPADAPTETTSPPPVTDQAMQHARVAGSLAATNTPPVHDAQRPSSWTENLSADYSLTLQQRYYPQSGLQQQASKHSSAELTAEWAWQSDNRAHQVVLQPFVRWDQRDNERNLIDLRQAYWQYAGSGFDIKAGVDIVFWGVTESQHLVDVINQTDLVASVDGEAKLGQPMLNWNLYGDGGTFSLYLLPYFRERTFAGIDGRLRLPLPVDTTHPLYESAQQQNNLDFALRWSRQFGAIDIALSYFEGNNRDPMFNSTAEGKLEPLYLQMQQLGIEGQLISGSWIWKLESLYRKTRIDDFAAATLGFEYTQVGLFDSDWDLGWIAEYQYDSRGRYAPVPGQNDVFVGGRFAANDAAGTELLLGIVQDLDHSGSQSGKLEASTRLSNNLRLQLDAWFFRSQHTAEPLYYIRRDDFVQLSLDYYF
ncbi:type IV pilus assembly protein FimV [Rheinheimera maricola]|uniref:LysM domain-containing protein n=1 Tax=Rheinheimera maricola TaxID=2793282 RepID=A0ABS7XD53_9GAMM|nr:FimV/HubP family polar landmark protein [Rheinheimera maricola]MBZ9613496.1 hypothetical protein [Rheinheimera maricola]